MSETIVVAIDGPAGSGKSSVSKAVARALGFAYLDTGAAYRAAAWHVLSCASDVNDPGAVAATLEGSRLSVRADADDFCVLVGDTDVTTAIREPRVTEAVSAVSRVPEVRARLNELFHHTISHCTLPGIVVEGRDITTVVAPDAETRILLTADERVRMERRGLEAPAHSRNDLTRQVRDRDAADARVSEFMTAADGVVTIDSTNLSFDQTVEAVVSHIRSATT